MTGKRQRLEQEIERAIGEWTDVPFAWGTADCILSPAEAIRRARGYDFAEKYRNRYSTRIGALRVTQSVGGIVKALEFALKEYGCREIRRSRAATGDLGLILKPNLSCVMFFRGAWVGRSETGFAMVPKERVIRAWRTA